MHTDSDTISDEDISMIIKQQHNYEGKREICSKGIYEFLA